MLVRDLESLSQIVGLRRKDGATKNDLFREQPSNEGVSHETIRVQPDDGLGLPNVVVPVGGDMDDFFASVATYYSDVSPISALVHVLGVDTAKLLPPHTKSREKAPQLVAPAQRRMCIGTAVGEAVAAATLSGDGTVAPSYSTCRRTLAFALARARFVHGSKIAATSVAHRWAAVRELTGLPVSASSSAAVTITHHLAMDVALPVEFPSFDKRILKALRFESISSDRLDSLGRILTDLYSLSADDIENLGGPFDGRMVAFRNIATAVKAGSSGRQLDEIAIAYFCNRIQPGSFAHSGVLASLANPYPASLIWYGYFSAASSHVAPSHMDRGLLAKLDRDLLKTFSFEGRPECDISFEELEVLSRIRLRPDAIRGSHARAILVALAPGVDVYTRFGAEADPQSEKIAGLMQSRDHARKLLEEALRIIGNPSIQNRPNGPTSERPRSKGASSKPR